MFIDLSVGGSAVSSAGDAEAAEGGVWQGQAALGCLGTNDF